MKKYLEILKKCRIFDGIDEEDLPNLLRCLGAKTDFYDKKYTVLCEGTPAKYIGVVLSGSVQVVQVDYFGNRSILSKFGAGETFAEAFACSEIDAMPVSVVADEPCEILMIDRLHILYTCSNHCGFHQRLIYNLMRDLATKTILFHRRIEVTSKRTTREKLLTYLMMQAKHAKSNAFDIPFDRQELADYLEVERSGLSAEIGKLRREGVLIAHKRHFELL